MKMRSRLVFDFSILIIFFPGCYLEIGVPDQRGYKSLDDLRTSGVAVVRLYATPIPIFGTSLVHTSFLIKSAEAQSFDRWEGWATSDGPYDYLRKNLYGEQEDFGGGKSFILAELIGTEAEPIVEFIENESIHYPYRDTKWFITGPNCNTYTQWVLNSTGWQVELPEMVIGKNYPAR